MARPHIPAAVRRAVIQRAQNRCEYCLLPAEWASIPHHVDHIIPLKHGGTTGEANLAYVCLECNLAKGPSIAAFDPVTGDMTRLFHPRTDKWSDHFQIDDGRLTGVSPLGRATVQLLRFNETSRVRQRKLLIAANVYELSP